MKIYYSRLSKEEKKVIKKEFKEKGDKAVYLKANKIIIFCLIGIFISCVSGVFDYLYKTGILNYLLDGFLFIFSIVFLFRMISIKKGELNKFALSKKKDK